MNASARLPVRPVRSPAGRVFFKYASRFRREGQGGAGRQMIYGHSQIPANTATARASEAAR